LCTASILLMGFSHGQSLVQTINSGGIAANVNASVGEIILTPVASNQSNTGIIGLLVQIKQQTLEVPSLQIDKDISVFPNPTTAVLNFTSTQGVAGETVSVYDNLGKKLQEIIISTDNSLDMTKFAAGIYILQFSENKNKTFKIIKH
jgi:Secretion system C-terminal sorting domain